VIKNVHKRFEGQQGVWQNYVDEHLLPRLHGFELMMAPYTMCHLKLGLTLAQTGYKEGNKRLGVYLTNSLEEAHPDTNTLFAQWLSEESNEANRIKKEMPIMVVLGNPPYSVSSTNKGKWIENLLKDYKKDLNEQNIQPLSDDYIKFLRFAQYNIEKTGHGIVAMITNNSFVDGIIHRQMRKSILESFDKIYVYNLHGNSKKKEVAPDGSKDENVFDIQQGVSINIFIKTTKSTDPAQVLHFDSYGLREKKYDELWKNDIESTQWKKLKPVDPYLFFVHKDFALDEEYKKGIRIDQFFEKFDSGVKTHNDDLTIHFNESELLEVKNDLLSMSEQDVKKKYELTDARDWKTALAQIDLKNNSPKDTDIFYRPFDIRKTLFTGQTKGFMAYPRFEIMRHFIVGQNYGLACLRQSRDGKGGIFVTKLATSKDAISSLDTVSIFPLYLYPDQDQTQISQASNRKPNLNPEIIAQIAQKVGLRFVDDGMGDGKTTFGPEDVLDYIYGVLHSPTYREKYKEFLKIDFPRVPFTEKSTIFWKLVGLGRELREVHLLESPLANKPITTYPVSGDNVVEKPRFENNKVWNNKAQHFDGVPEVAWSFFIGGYQPAQKWLKDRKGRALSFDDIMHYQKIIVALTETERIMKEVDGVTKEWI